MKNIDRFQGEYRFLSNFWPCDIEYDGMIFPSVENAYQASKTLSSEARRMFQCGTPPGKAKSLGKSLDVRKDWEHVKVEIMEYLVKQKFSREPLKKSLLDTGDVLLVEGNTWGDFFWGVCNGKGRNMLGRILMKVRGELKE